MDLYSQNFTVPTLGMYTLQYGKTWPELATLLSKLYADKVASMPWLPQNWLATVSALHNGPNGEIMVPAPTSATYSGGKGIPWLDTPEKRQWWDALANTARSIITKYADKKAAEGRIELEKAYAAADFWNVGMGMRIINAAQVLAAPVTAAQAVAKGVTSYPKATIAVVAVGGALVLGFLWWWYHPRPNRR